VTVDEAKLCVMLHMPHTVLSCFDIEGTIIIACARKLENFIVFYGQGGAFELLWNGEVSLLRHHNSTCF
jgi:hypothetical protein